MNAEMPVAPAWTRWEKHKHRALVAIAILASVLIAAAPRNERRLFLLPQVPMALAAIPAPEPTSLRSAIMGYLDDGCSPDLDGSVGFDRAIERNDCGRGRKREKPAMPEVAQPAAEPAAFFAMTDDPLPIDGSLLVISELSPEPVNLPHIGGAKGSRSGSPGWAAGLAPPILLAAIPEPASWALMLGGFCLAGAVLRRRGASADPRPI